MSRDFYTNPILPYNTKPFQKIERSTKFIPSQYQMPAYFMPYAMHGGFTNGPSFWLATFNKKFIRAKDAIVRNKNIIQEPHFLESYYLLTKHIISLGFN